MEIDIELIKTLAIPVGAILTWLTKDRILSALNIKQEKNNVEGGQLENVQKALDLWQEMLDDAVRRHKIQVGELEGIIAVLKKDFKELEDIAKSKDAIIASQKALIAEQKTLIEKQSRSITYYKNKYEKNK